MSKKIKSYIKLQVLSGMANPSPPVGPILGQNGLNIMNFCKLFNQRTSHLDKGIPIPVIITVFSDRTFDFIIKSPTVSYLIKKYSLVEKGSNNPGKKIIGSINKKQLIKIAQIKILDSNSYNIEKLIKSIIGTANSMGIEYKI